MKITKKVNTFSVFECLFVFNAEKIWINLVIFNDLNDLNDRNDLNDPNDLNDLK